MIRSSMEDADYKTVQHLREENSRLRKAVDELSVLNDLAMDIGGSVDSGKIMRSVISRSIRAVGAEQGDITLIDKDSAGNKHTLVRSMVSSAGHSALHLEQNLLGWMQIHKKSLVLNNPGRDERFREVKWDPSILSVLSAPLMVKSNLIGILTVYNKKEEDGFTESDRRLLSIIASQSAQVVENVRLYEEEQAYREMQQEVELAAKIQKKLLPAEPPEVAGYRISGKNNTAFSVGGDYFDFIRIDEGLWAICLGDVSGKGMPAALLMANLQAILRSHLVSRISPAEVLKIANQQLFKNTGAEQFATFFLGILDTTAHILRYSNGGHEYPYLISSDRKQQRLQRGGLPLGMLSQQEYQEDTVDMQSGDCLFIYSDGITESMNTEEEEFGEQRLQEILLKGRRDHDEPDRLIDTIFAASIKHRGQRQLFDDMTAVAVLRNP